MSTSKNGTTRLDIFGGIYGSFTVGQIPESVFGNAGKVHEVTFSCFFSKICGNNLVRFFSSPLVLVP